MSERIDPTSLQGFRYWTGAITENDYVVLESWYGSKNVLQALTAVQGRGVYYFVDNWVGSVGGGWECDLLLISGNHADAPHKSLPSGLKRCPANVGGLLDLLGEESWRVRLYGGESAGVLLTPSAQANAYYEEHGPHTATVFDACCLVAKHLGGWPRYKGE